jgi:hypothetical protein
VLDGSDNPRLPTFLCINVDQKSIQEYLDGMAALDPTVRYLVTHPQEAIVHDGLLANGRDAHTRRSRRSNSPGPRTSGATSRSETAEKKEVR